MRPSPETDAITVEDWDDANKEADALALLARRLEAERDALRGERDTAIWLLQRWDAAGFTEAKTLSQETHNFLLSLGPRRY